MDKLEKRTLCERYVDLVFTSYTERLGAELDSERRDLHDIICSEFKIDKMSTQMVTSRLDIWLGVKEVKKITPQFIVSNGAKLMRILQSELVRAGNYGDVKDELRRLQNIWYEL